MTRDESPAYRSIQRYLVAGTVIVGLVIFGLGGWAATAQLSGAIIAQGRLVVETNVKKVQHLTGGVIGELRVREGDHVRVGDILLRLDETLARTNYTTITKGLDELAARKAREEAERDGAESLTFSPDLLARQDQPELGHVLSGEQKLFEIRRKAREGQKSQLMERIEQHKEEISGLAAQLSAKISEIEWVQKELEGVRGLWSQKLVQFTRVTALERDAARVEGERGNLLASIAQAKGKIAEIRLQILQIDQDMRTEVGKDLADIRGKTSDLVEKRVAAQDQLNRIDVRAPQDGTVHQLDVHTVGGVITPGEPIMLIVPDADALTVEARFQPQDIDQLHVGQAAVLRFSAFNQRTTPEINGEVKLVSPDVAQDQKSGAYYYTVRIAIPDTEMARLENLKLVPGMPVDAFLQASSRTFLSYLTRPLYDQVTRTFREK
jgi:HlyD family secretion protein